MVIRFVLVVVCAVVLTVVVCAIGTIAVDLVLGLIGRWLWP